MLFGTMNRLDDLTSNMQIDRGSIRYQYITSPFLSNEPKICNLLMYVNFEKFQDEQAKQWRVYEDKYYSSKQNSINLNF